MKYVVTGGAGFIGSNIVEELVRLGQEVTVIDDLSTGKLENLDSYKSRIRFVKGSVLDLELLKKIFAGVDYVLHQAAIPSVPRSIENPIASNEVNISGTLNVLMAARDCKVKRVVYASSSSVYGDSPKLPKDETMQPNPLSPYALNKLSGEYYCRIFYSIYGLETVSLRYFNVFGPRQDPNSFYSAVIPKFISAMSKDQSPVIFGDGETSRDFCYVKNVVNANLLACTAKGVAGEYFNIACNERTSLKDLVNKINSILGRSVPARFDAGRAGDIKHSLAAIEKAKRLLGYDVEVGFDDGLKRTVDYYKGCLK